MAIILMTLLVCNNNGNIIAKIIITMLVAMVMAITTITITITITTLMAVCDDNSDASVQW